MTKNKLILIGLALLIIIGFGIFYIVGNQTSDQAEDPNVSEDHDTSDDQDTLQPLAEFSDTYDVIVVGGEPEGVAAAVSAARNGAKTLIIEHRDAFGGLFTYGFLNFLDIPQGEDGASVSKGIYEEWH